MFSFVENEAWQRKKRAFSVRFLTFLTGKVQSDKNGCLLVTPLTSSRFAKTISSASGRILLANGKHSKFPANPRILFPGRFLPELAPEKWKCFTGRDENSGAEDQLTTRSEKLFCLF